ncbi:hypothetical protein GCM10010344_54630 [Streptomyces bluensis]|nr:hypothetical protein GCM10010344_54630 [Streptomyces bluensis]
MLLPGPPGGSHSRQLDVSRIYFPCPLHWLLNGFGHRNGKCLFGGRKGPTAATPDLPAVGCAFGRNITVSDPTGTGNSTDSTDATRRNSFVTATVAGTARKRRERLKPVADGQVPRAVEAGVPDAVAIN